MQELTTLPPNLPPAELIEISPEDLMIANHYLQFQDVRKTSEELDVSVGEVTDIIHKKEVRRYIDNVFMDMGYNNRVKMRKAMDAVIAKKFQELEESSLGSAKDIADLLMLSHKMSMEQMDKQIQLEKLRSNKADVNNQVNLQINNPEPQSNYDRLLTQLLSAGPKQ